jgi:hypothetical protein
MVLPVCKNNPSLIIGDMPVTNKLKTLMTDIRQGNFGNLALCDLFWKTKNIFPEADRVLEKVKQLCKEHSCPYITSKDGILTLNM